MDTVVRPPASPPTEPVPTVAGARRWPKRLMLAAAVATILAVIATNLFLATYQPLDARSTGGEAVRPADLIADEFMAYGAEGNVHQYIVRWAPGRTITIMFPLWNEGDLPVSIEGLVPVERADYRLRLAGTASIERGPLRPTDRTGSFTLAPGEGRQVFLEIEMQASPNEGTSYTFNSVGLEIRTWWVRRSVTLPLVQSVLTCVDPCPER